MATRVGLESYEVQACHGVFDFEREKTQPFVISIWATLVAVWLTILCYVF